MQRYNRFEGKLVTIIKRYSNKWFEYLFLGICEGFNNATRPAGLKTLLQTQTVLIMWSASNNEDGKNPPNTELLSNHSLIMF